ncbi:hypothetical protein [Streptomyces sp. NPDC002044]|uniref:hypothetical protein n=1 Tax=Streptomyces sp. NPDC002044 TaxID=3154662 RepID=UPI00332253BE
MTDSYDYAAPDDHAENHTTPDDYADRDSSGGYTAYDDTAYEGPSYTEAPAYENGGGASVYDGPSDAVPAAPADPYRLDDAPDGAPHPDDPYPYPYDLDGPETDPAADGAGTPPGYREGDSVVGDPAAAALYWHEQEQPFSCAVVAQEYVLDRVTGTDRAEADLADLAAEKGWYHPGGGTAIDDMARLLEHHGVTVTARDGADLVDLRDALADGDHVIVPVDSGEILGPEDKSPVDLEGVNRIPGQDGADHVVVVTAVDYSDPSRPVVVLNDSGHPGGAGVRVPMETFYRAWTDSGHHMVRAEGTPRTDTDD